KPLISIEGWVDHIGHSFFAVGGVSALVQSVLPSAIWVKPSANREVISGRGRVDPNIAEVPVAVHARGPGDRLHTITAESGSGGFFSFEIRSMDGAFEPGEYEVIGYILPGSVLAEAESDAVKVAVQ